MNLVLNGNINQKDGLGGIKKKKKLFTKLQIKNYKDRMHGMRSIIPDDQINNLHFKERAYKINMDIIRNSRNSFEKQNPRINEEINSYEKNIMKFKNSINFNNLKIINSKTRSKNKGKENSLKKKILNYNIKELKRYNKLVNKINININNISRSIHNNYYDNYSKPSVTNNNFINLNVILNDTINNNNNKNLESLQMNNNPDKLKKSLPTTPSQERYVSLKKSTLPSITISDRIKPKIEAHKFKSINNTKYLSTESNYERIERQKRIFLDNVNRKHEYLRFNYPKNYRINTNI